MLTEEGYLRTSSAATFANPDRVEPTAKLIREIEESEEGQETPPRELVAGSRKVFLVHGAPRK